MQMLGEWDEKVGQGAANLGNIYFKQNNTEKACDYYKKAIAIRTRTNGETDTEAVKLKFQLCGLLYKNNKKSTREEANQILVKVLRELEKINTEGNENEENQQQNLTEVRFD